MNVTYGSIVPLIGGENLGIMESMDGQLPEWMLSYSDFSGNDEHLVQYLRNKKGWDKDYILLDENENYKAESVDIVNTVCPCAGLSSLSRVSGATSEVNDWMYRTTEYVLGTVRPKVFWGENAPRLYSKTGEPVVNRLHEIGMRNGYTLNLYQTSSNLHGLAQKRPRTFYFFTEGLHEAPIFRYIRRPIEPIEDVLTKEPRPDDPMDKVINPLIDPYHDAWVNYCLKMTNTNNLREFFDVIEETTNCIVMVERDEHHPLLEVADWMDENGYDPKFSRRARFMKKKLDDGKGYWGHGVTVPKGRVPSFIGAHPFELINPFRETYVTFRDGLRIMKHPDDFDMVVDEKRGQPTTPNHMCQNVPVTTARDMSDFVLEYLRGDTDTVRGNLVKQSNVKMEHDVVSREESSLEEFISLHRS